jgi:hypothetical protein
MLLQAPEHILHPLQRHRDPTAALGRALYSVRTGLLVRAEMACGPGRWTCSVLQCCSAPQCTIVLTDADLSTALDPDVLTEAGHPDPASHLIAYRAAWRSRIRQRLGSNVWALADQLAENAGPDLMVEFVAARARVHARGPTPPPAVSEPTLTRFIHAALLRPITITITGGDGVRRAALTLPPAWIAVPI